MTETSSACDIPAMSVPGDRSLPRRGAWCSAGTAYHVDVHRGIMGLAELAPAWVDLAARCRQPAFFHHPAWFEAYLSCLAPAPGAVVFCSLWRGERLVAVAPLERQTRFLGVPCRIARLPQDVEHMPAGDLVVDRDEDLVEAADAILSSGTWLGDVRWDALLLECVPATANWADALRSGDGYRTRSRPAGFSDHVMLRPIDELLQQLSSKVRKDLRNSRNRLERAGRTEYTVANGSAELGPALEAFMDLEDSGWKGRSGTSIRRNPRLTRFYRMLAQRADKACDVHVLSVNGRPVAGLFALTAATTAYFLKVGYDETFAALSPGNNLELQAMRHYVETTPVRTLNLMSDYRYLHMWNPERRPVLNLSVFNHTVAGTVACGCTRVQEAGRTVQSAAGRWQKRAMAQIKHARHL